MAEDISIKEFFIKTSDYLSYLLGSWKFITLSGILTALVLMGLNFNKPSLYEAKLSFMLNEEEGSPLGSIGNILGQFGLGSGGSESNLDKIIELSRARIITQNALFDIKPIAGQEDFLANHMINSMQKENNWDNDGILSFLSMDDEYNLDGFKFSHDSFPSFSLLENKALKKLHKHLMGKELEGGAFQSHYSELSGIMNFSLTTTSAELSVKTVNNLYSKLSEYYLGKNSEKQLKDFKIIKSKYDSIQSLLDKTMYGIAQFEDKNQGLIKKQDSYRLKKMKAEEMKLGSMLAEAEKQYQIAQISLDSKSDYIQLIDQPLLPLRPANKGKLYYFLLGGLLGGIFSISYLMIKKIYSDVMSA